MSSLPNPKFLLNIKNNNDYCFLYCIAAYFHREYVDYPDNPNEPAYLDFIETLDVTNMNFPCQISDLEQFALNNKKLDICLNIFCIHQKNIYPSRLNIGRGNHVISILIVDIPKKTKKENGAIYGVGHAILILDLNRFLAKQYPC